MAAQVSNSNSSERLCSFCGQPLAGHVPQAKERHRSCTLTLEAHYTREVRAIKDSMKRTLELLDKISIGELI